MIFAFLLSIFNTFKSLAETNPEDLDLVSQKLTKFSKTGEICSITVLIFLATLVIMFIIKMEIIIRDFCSKEEQEEPIKKSEENTENKEIIENKEN
jgi:ammonia channel protein AmtB